MSNISGIILNEQQVMGASIVCLTGQRHLKEYKDGKSTEKVLGVRFEVVSPAKCFANFSIKIEDGKLLDVTDTEIESACMGLNPIFVRFEGFRGKIYAGSNSSVNVSCSATGVSIVSQDEAMEYYENLALGGDY